MLAVATSLVLAVSSASPIAVAHDDASIPAPCQARAGALTVSRLLQAAGSRRANDARGLLAPAGRFQWFDTQFTKKDRRFAGTTLLSVDALTAHFAKRHRQAERQQLIAIELRYDPANDQAVFDPLYRYRANDYTGGRWRLGRGKAVLDCRSGGIRAWASIVEVAKPILAGRVCGQARKTLVHSSRITACASRSPS